MITKNNEALSSVIYSINEIKNSLNKIKETSFDLKMAFMSFEEAKSELDSTNIDSEDVVNVIKISNMDFDFNTEYLDSIEDEADDIISAIDACYSDLLMNIEEKEFAQRIALEEDDEECEQETDNDISDI